MGYIQLRNYAEWYYTKYFPSRATLREKLERKCDDMTLVEKVMTELASLIVEDKIIESRVHAYLSQGKTAQYIRLKLAQKKFDKNLVALALQEVQETLENPETYRSQIERIIAKGIQKGSSKKSLIYELQMKYPDARDLVGELLREYDDQEILQKKAPELLRKYSQEQVLGKLGQKGFQFSDIYAVLRRR